MADEAEIIQMSAWQTPGHPEVEQTATQPDGDYVAPRAQGAGASLANNVDLRRLMSVVQEVAQYVRELVRRVDQLERRLPVEADDRVPSREDVGAEQAAEEIIRLLENTPRPLRPSEIAAVLALDLGTVADGVDLLRERGWAGPA